MKIAIDLRSLSSGSVSGVENYILNLLENLLPMDKKNSYTLFYNSWRKNKLEDYHFVNSITKISRIPNKILNAALISKTIKLEKLAGEFDCLFMPNLNQFNISPNAKLAITVHDLSPVVTPEFYDFKRNLWHKLLHYQKAFDRANLIFAVSEYTKQDLIRIFKVDEKKIKIVYPGIDHKVFNPGISHSKLREVRNLYGLPGDYVLFLNTIEPRKNLTNLIKAFDNLDHPTYLVIAGKKGWKYRKIFKQIRKSRKIGKIKYLGYVKEEDKPAIIKLSKALVYPSFYEGFGFQPLEAMACGVPTIVSQLTALPEIVQDSSLLINPYDPNNITNALNQILTDQKLRARLIEKGIKRAGEFGWNKFAGQILQGLNELSNN